MALPTSFSEKDSLLQTTPLPSPSDNTHRFRIPRITIAPLTRLDKLDFYYVLIPILTGALFSANVNGTSIHVFPLLLLKLLVLSFPLAFLTFIWNDTLNVVLDQQDKDACSRPISTGAISLPKASIMILGQFSACVMALLLLPKETWVVSALGAIGIAAYPFTKRRTLVSHMCFGVTMAMGVLVGSSANRLTPFLECRGIDGCQLEGLYKQTESLLWFFAAHVVWAVRCKIIHNLREREDDDADVKENAISLEREKKKKPLLLALAAMQTMLFVVAGLRGRAGPTYLVLITGTMNLSTVWELRSVDLQDFQSWNWWSSRGPFVTAASIAVGLLVNYLPRIL